jgi:hypothetical protein
MRLFTVSLALAALFAPQAQGPFRVHTYLIPAKMEQRWITIEYDNPKCPPLSENDSGRELVIPETGFLCTSSQRESGRHRAEYYVVDEHQRRTALKPDQWIQRRESFTTRSISSATGSAESLCDVAGDGREDRKHLKYVRSFCSFKLSTCCRLQPATTQAARLIPVAQRHAQQLR